MQVSNIAQFEKSLLDNIRAFFKNLHEILYEMENRKTSEIEEMLRTLFGTKISVDEVTLLEDVGVKHKETLQQLMHKNKFVFIVKEYQNKLNSYLKEVETINAQAT